MLDSKRRRNRFAREPPVTETSFMKEFPGVSEEAWRALVDKALKGAKFDDALVSQTHDGLRIEPLYTRQDETVPDPAGLPGRAPFARGFRQIVDQPAWDIRQLHASGDPAGANKQILADLEGGATSLTLRQAAPEQNGLAVASDADLARALDGVYPEYIGIALEPGADFVGAAQHLMAFWTKRGLAGDAASGGFGADPIGCLARAGGLPMSLDQALDQAVGLARTTSETYPLVTALLADGRPYHDGGASEAMELACLTATLVAYLRAAEKGGLGPSDALPQIGFALAADADQFLSIAKLRAARSLINRIAEVSGAQSALPGLRLQAQTSARMMTTRDPQVNLLRTMTAAAAAALGGADSITVLPFTWAMGATDLFAQRIARNIQLILQEESSLGRVLDSAGGSWYVESLTRQLGEKAWELFQQIESDGGMAEALAKGSVQHMIRETAEARQRAVDTAKEELIGVTAFPQLADGQIKVEPRPAPESFDDPAVTVEPIPLRRPAEPFEMLRDAADAWAQKTGARPQIFLANLGKPSEFSGRARYATNLFASGGIEALPGDGASTPKEAAKAFKSSGAKIACLCSNDDVYASIGADTAQDLAKAGAEYIYLAGRPGDLRKTLKAAGVEAFIHKGCDMVAALKKAQDVLGVARN